LPRTGGAPTRAERIVEELASGVKVSRDHFVQHRLSRLPGPEIGIASARESAETTRGSPPVRRRSGPGARAAGATASRSSAGRPAASRSARAPCARSRHCGRWRRSTGSVLNLLTGERAGLQMRIDFALEHPGGKRDHPDDDESDVGVDAVLSADVDDADAPAPAYRAGPINGTAQRNRQYQTQIQPRRTAGMGSGLSHSLARQTGEQSTSYGSNSWIRAMSVL
jgi:hypothetical protein